MTQAATTATTEVTTDLRAATYTKPRPTDGSFGVEIITTVTGPDGEHTTTHWHGIDPRDGLAWSKERASLLLAVLGYRKDGGWVQIGDQGGAPIFGTTVVPTAN